MAVARKDYIHPLFLRLWHGFHGICVLVLIGTGAQLRFPGQIHIVPNFRIAIEVHNTAGLLVTLSFFVWFFYHAIIAGSLGTLYLPRRGELSTKLRAQLRYYFGGYFHGEPDPHQPTSDNKFNPIEKPLYLLVMLGLFPVQMVTGMALKSLSPPWKIIDMFGSIKGLIAIHWIVGCAIMAFLLLHVYLSTLGVTFWSRFRTILHGWTEEKR